MTITHQLTDQEKFWKGEFGEGYRDRNDFNGIDGFEQYYINQYGVDRTTMNKDFLGQLSLNNLLEVGCNIGRQVQVLEKSGQKNIFGIEINSESAKVARGNCPYANIVEGSAFDLPFKDNFFDLVYTSGVLIHINPTDLPKAMDEMYRTSKKYIWGFEYHAETTQEINYRGNTGFLWKANFAQLYLDRFPDLKLVKQQLYPYISNNEKGNTDVMYLLEKQ